MWQGLSNRIVLNWSICLIKFAMFKCIMEKPFQSSHRPHHPVQPCSIARWIKSILGSAGIDTAILKVILQGLRRHLRPGPGVYYNLTSAYSRGFLRDVFCQLLSKIKDTSNSLYD